MVDSKTKILQTIRDLCQEIGHFPSQRELQERQLLNRFYKAGLKMRKLRFDWGYTKQENEPAFWTENTIIQYLKQIRPVAYHQLPPTLKNVIKASDKSLYDYLDQIGIPHHKPKGYWLKFSNLRKEIALLIEKNNGVFPSLTVIEKHLGSAAKKAVLNRGGIFALASAMGLPYKSKLEGRFMISTDGHVLQSSMEYLFDEYLCSRDIYHTVGGKISDDLPYLYDFKIGDHYVEIWGYERDRNKNPIVKRYNNRRLQKEKIYSNLGLSLISIEASVFKEPMLKIIETFDNIIARAGFDPLPTRNMNLSKYYENSSLWNRDKIAYALLAVISQIGHFPKQSELKEIGRGDLSDAIGRREGLIWYANFLGFNRKPRTTWSKEKIRSALHATIKNVGHFPTHQELTKMGSRDLSQAIMKHGKTQFWKDLFISSKNK